MAESLIVATIVIAAVAFLFKKGVDALRAKPCQDEGGCHGCAAKSPRNATR